MTSLTLIISYYTRIDSFHHKQLLFHTCQSSVPQLSLKENVRPMGHKITSINRIISTYLHQFWILTAGMLIFENFISRHENFKSRESSRTRNLTRHWEMVSEWVGSRAHLPSPHPLGINYHPVQTTRVTDVILVARVALTGRCPGLEGPVSSVCRHVQAQHIHCMLCLQMVI